MARTMFTPADTWGPQVMVTELDTIYSSFTNGAKLAIDPSGTVHTGLMIAERATTIWNTYYAYTTDAGLTWSEREVVSLLPLVQQWDPSIAVDDAGSAYLAWQDMRDPKAEIWFATNATTGMEEQAPTARRLTAHRQSEPLPRQGHHLRLLTGPLDHSATRPLSSPPLHRLLRPPRSAICNLQSAI